MDQWEKEQEEIIRHEHALQKKKPKSAKQQQRFMRKNWIETTDAHGNLHYVPKENCKPPQKPAHRTLISTVRIGIVIALAVLAYKMMFS